MTVLTKTQTFIKNQDLITIDHTTIIDKMDTIETMNPEKLSPKLLKKLLFKKKLCKNK